MRLALQHDQYIGDDGRMDAGEEHHEYQLDGLCFLLIDGDLVDPDAVIAKQIGLGELSGAESLLVRGIHGLGLLVALLLGDQGKYLQREVHILVQGEHVLSFKKDADGMRE
ncbi:hypothetical protein SDC9_120404 [bioreactor metagenome]|uniref:Uncharacterized protein n=1 Tax=bioreactor metagenome TaxID=1076179 RepID=A0A645C9Q6_9ZZZZ